MKAWALGLAVVLAAGPVGLWVAGESPAPTHVVQLNGHRFTLPTGFTIELVAGPPLVNRPIVADFDEQGRLYVADSSGSNDKVAEQLAKKPHRILRLEDTKGDGRYDRVTVFADRMMFPEGILCDGGSVYVAAPPSIWKLTDTDGDGVADQRSEWFQGKTLTGCANDLHGPYLGPDGRIYWCKGAFAQQTYQRPGQPPLVTRAAHIFRARSDGTEIEPVMTGGMDNPVEIAFTAGGERIFTTTFLQHPADGRRDGLIHAVYGGLYGKPHDVLSGHPRTRPGLMPVLTHLGPAAPCGLCRYESHLFGDGYRDNLFAALFNLQKVSRHELIPAGSTFTTRDRDFVVSDNRDFHPTDVLEDADGSLLVVDTGGWYKLCCPTSQLHKPDVLGGIYRVRRPGLTPLNDPRGLKLPWEKMTAEQLVTLLDDERPAVRKRAICELATGTKTRDAALARACQAGRSPTARRNAVWAAARSESAQARQGVRAALEDADESVRQAASHVAGLWRDTQAVPSLMRVLSGSSLPSRRAAAEALGRTRDRAAVPALLTALDEAKDATLTHSLTYALIEIADRDGTAAGLADPRRPMWRAALMALEQIPDGRCDPHTVIAALASEDIATRDAAVWVAGRHPEWGDKLATSLRDRLAKVETNSARDELIRQLTQFAAAPPVQKLLAEPLGAAPRSAARCRVALRAMAQSALKQVPVEWTTSLANMLADADAMLVRDSITTAGNLRLTRGTGGKLAEALVHLGSQESSPPDLRLAALAAIPEGLVEVPQPLFAFVRARLAREYSAAERALAVQTLAQAHLGAEQLVALAEVLGGLNPLEIDRLLGAFAQSTDDRVGLRLLEALRAPTVRPSLRAETLKKLLAKFSPTVRKAADELYVLLESDTAQQRARLEQLSTTLKAGDVRRGQAVFHSTKALCTACHAVGYLGGRVGPDLTRIGAIRSERDLLEAIVFPSASFVRSYEPVMVATKNGKAYNGLIRKDAPDEIVLATGPNQEVRIARDEIEEIQPSRVSIMPAGLDQQLTPRELADLIAFLRACK